MIISCMSKNLYVIVKLEERKGHITSKCREERKPAEAFGAAKILLTLNRDTLSKMYKSCHA